jgi:DNA repair photolyase
MEVAVSMAKKVLEMRAAIAERLGAEKKAVREEEILELAERYIAASQRRVSLKELSVYFQHTKFGCMNDPMVTHFETLDCAHKCTYCYAESYKQLRKKNREAVKSATDEQLAWYARIKAIQLIEKMMKLLEQSSKTTTTASQILSLPELHCSVSTDIFSPEGCTQDIAYVVVKEWLEMGLLFSCVSKGVPLGAERRAKFLDLFRKHKEAVSFQCTCASADKKLQVMIEPGAPEPLVRLEFLKDVISAGVMRFSLRINPLIPGHNDNPKNISEMLDYAHDMGIKSVVVSYVYGTGKIKSAMAKTKLAASIRFFKADRGEMHGAGNKFHVLDERRKQVLEFAIGYSREKKYGMVIRSCGCDNADIFPEHACGICWRSGGIAMNPTMERPKKTVVVKKPICTKQKHN